MRLLKKKWLALLGLILALLTLRIWFLPFQGTVLISTQPLDPQASFPQYLFDPTAPKPDEEVLVTITDNVPWTHVSLTVNNESALFVQTQALPIRQLWSWTWRFQLPTPTGEMGPDEPTQTVLAFYRDCNSGCRLRDQRTLEPYATASQALPQPMGMPTKLCVAFPDPNRNWHGRSGWITDLTYAQSQVAYWQIDALAQRVQENSANSQKVLVRVDYAPEQSLPPENDSRAVALYLQHIRRLARDERLRQVYGYIIGASFNTIEGNVLAPDNPTTPEWYAQLFNGALSSNVTAQTTQGFNIISTVRANNPTVRALIGAVRPWAESQSGAYPYKTDAPWLNYMNTLVRLLHENTIQSLQSGIPLSEPDGFALNVPGRPDLLDNEKVEFALEPTLDILQPQWPEAQGGFRVYTEWLAIINSYPTTQGKPAFITATNTADARLPSENYPPGWLTNALKVINQEPQVESLCWFLDKIPGDQRWQGFSLDQQQGLMRDAAQEFDKLLQK